MAKKEKRNLEYTVFQEKTVFRGNLEFSKPLQILGSFEGEIRGDGILEIGETARVQAQVYAGYLIVYGKITGNIYATEKVELRQGAQVVGNIRTPNLEVDDGVVFEGQVEMKQVEEPQAS